MSRAHFFRLDKRRRALPPGASREIFFRYFAAGANECLGYSEQGAVTWIFRVGKRGPFNWFRVHREEGGKMSQPFEAHFRTGSEVRAFFKWWRYFEWVSLLDILPDDERVMHGIAFLHVRKALKEGCREVAYFEKKHWKCWAFRKGKNGPYAVTWKARALGDRRRVIWNSASFMDRGAFKDYIDEGRFSSLQWVSIRHALVV